MGIDQAIVAQEEERKFQRQREEAEYLTTRNSISKADSYKLLIL
ncbi:hypothetical protein [Deinococcus frigens]